MTSQLEQDYTECPDRVVDSVGVADCNFPDNHTPRWICSYKREKGICPRDLP